MIDPFTFVSVSAIILVGLNTPAPARKLAFARARVGQGARFSA